ncbi:hypothetical protein BJY01DRAFT_247281 [Aspergillus pseudoustus]|uniref:General substrate transporter n=1 Tax=Aspergillus pseudoustus TaxID=1810923 RepID=A0ABR4K2Z7_9EURO
MTFAFLPSIRPKGRVLSMGITVSCGLAFMLFGYDQGVFGGILANPAFKEQFNHPDTTVGGQIVSSRKLHAAVRWHQRCRVLSARGAHTLILSAIDSMQWMFWAGMASFVIDRVGRRRLLILGSAGQCLCFAMAALGLGIGTRALNGVAVAFIFLYYVFFGLSFLVIPFMYPAGINSQHTRNVGSAIAMVTNWLGVIGWKFYLVFAITNCVFCPICWYFYVETSGLSLEEIDRGFEIKYYADRSMTYKEATHLENVELSEKAGFEA